MSKKRPSNRFLLFVTGGVTLLVGVTLVLVWWDDVLALFRGFVGMFLAVGGLVILYMMKD